MLTARGQESDRLTGFLAGADDSSPKPFSVHELIARIRAILRRTRGSEGPPQNGIAHQRSRTQSQQTGGDVRGATP